MPSYKVYKETALPGTLVANSIYLVAPAANPAYLEIYVTDNAGAASRRTHRVQDIQAMIDTALAGLSGGATIVNDITARNALASPKNGQTVLVIDASADVTVNSGAATYIYRSTGATWVKISKSESMELVLSWANITGKPSSTPAAIDAAVTASHSHTNKTQIDKIGEDGNGDLTYNGQNIAPRLTSSAW